MENIGKHNIASCSFVSRSIILLSICVVYLSRFDIKSALFSGLIVNFSFVPVNDCFVFSRYAASGSPLQNN
jgi:hypothetical protein